MNTLHLNIGAADTTAVLSLPDGREQRWRLPIGLATLWPEVAHSGGPSALMIEHAIQTVEDQVERLAGHIPAGARLVVAAGAMAPLQRAGAIWGQANEAIALAQIELEYQQLAARSVGAPSATGSGFDDPAGDALVLILRECLHHLGFDAVHLGA
jgi:hypothetical protein